MDGTWLYEVSHEAWSGVGRGGESRRCGVSRRGVSLGLVGRGEVCQVGWVDVGAVCQAGWGRTELARAGTYRIGMACRAE